MRKISLNRWLVVTILFAIFANIAHPVTPMFIKNLGLSDSMFGWAYAGMAITNFIFSPLWSKLCERYGSTSITIISLIFYGVSQLMFGYSTTISTIMFARLFGGFFIGGLFVAQLVYIVDNASGQEKGETLVKNATMQIVFGTIGFLIGGLIGNYSIKAAFIFQFSGLILTALYVFLFIAETKRTRSSEKIIFSEINPFNSLSTPEVKSNLYLRRIFIVSILASTATVLYDQTFNYYMADFFNFLPSVNGTIKAITGILAFVSNSTLTLWIIKRNNLTVSLSSIFLSVAVFILALINIEVPFVFLAINIIYFTIHASYLPIIQKMAVDDSINQNSTIGVLNSLKSLGMIIGAIIAGQAYAFYKKLPFILAIVIFVISAILTFSSKKLKKVN